MPNATLSGRHMLRMNVAAAGVELLVDVVEFTHWTERVFADDTHMFPTEIPATWFCWLDSMKSPTTNPLMV